MQTLFQFITRASLGVITIWLGSVVLGILFPYLFDLMKRPSALAFLPLFLLIVCKYAATFCFFVLGTKVGAICLSEILRRKWGVDMALPAISSSDLRYDALTLVGLTVILVFYYSSVMQNL